MKLSIIKSIVLGSCPMAFLSCEKNYLDVNKDPNHPHVLVPKQILPAAIGHTAYVMGKWRYQVIGGYWKQYWTQGPTGNQYNVWSISDFKYNIGSAMVWFNSSPLTDFQDIIRLSSGTEQQIWRGISCIMVAYIYRCLRIYMVVFRSRKHWKQSGVYAPHYDSNKVFTMDWFYSSRQRYCRHQFFACRWWHLSTGRWLHIRRWYGFVDSFCEH